MSVGRGGEVSAYIGRGAREERTGIHNGIYMLGVGGNGEFSWYGLMVGKDRSEL